MSTHHGAGQGGGGHVMWAHRLESVSAAFLAREARALVLLGFLGFWLIGPLYDRVYYHKSHTRGMELLEAEDAILRVQYNTSCVPSIGADPSDYFSRVQLLYSCVHSCI